jgi:outer membrane protein OmpA-like peptidoglycan-associated protein
MPVNLVSLVMQFLTPDVVAKIAAALGLDRTVVQNLINSAVPALLGTLGGVATQPGGPQKLADAAKQTASLDDLTSLLHGGNSTSLADNGAQLLSSLLGGQEQGLTSAISKFAGVGQGPTTSLLGMLTPLLFGAIAKAQGASGLNASGIASLFAAQKDHVADALPPQLRRELGATRLLGAFEGSANKLAGVANSAAADTSRGAASWLVPLIALVAAGGLIWYVFGRLNEQSVQAPVPQSSTAQAPAAPGSQTTIAPSATPSIPSVTIGGVDVGKEVDASLGSLRSSLQGVTDAASANLALPKLQQANAEFDKIGSVVGQMSPDQRKLITSMFAPALPTLNQLFDKLLAIPGVAEVLKPSIDGLRGKLTSISSALAGTAAAVPADHSSYAFSAVRNDGTLTLTGSFPDQATHQSVLAAAQRMFGGEHIVDNTTIVPGAPEGFGQTVTALLTQLSRLGNGTVKLSGTDAEISGAAWYDRAAGAIRSAMTSLPGGFHVKTDIGTVSGSGAVDAVACQGLFATILSKAQIQFETGSAVIETASTGLLDNLVAIAQRCPSAHFEVAGYTDNQGADDVNMALSQRRAQSVADYLSAEGVDQSRIRAVGYGSSKPIGSNDTDDGRAKNRRIEITAN